MERFNSRGMLLIPNPLAPGPAPRKVLVMRQLYCPAAHELISPRVHFHTYPGILIRARAASGEGLVGLSPIYGDRSRIALDIDFTTGEIRELSCPTCGAPLPVHSPCPCGADLVSLFTTPQADFADCIGICNRVDCPQAHIILNDELIRLAEISEL